MSTRYAIDGFKIAPHRNHMAGSANGFSAMSVKVHHVGDPSWMWAVVEFTDARADAWRAFYGM
jgi:hypothetical protein